MGTTRTASNTIVVSRLQKPTMASSTNETETPSVNNRLSVYQDNASDVYPCRIRLKNKDHDWKAQMVQVVQAMCPFLRGHPLEIAPLSGGLSNELFVVQMATSNKDSHDSNNTHSDNPSAVLVRLHPSSGSLQIANQATVNTITDSTEGTSSSSDHSPAMPVNTLEIVDRTVENALSAWLSSQHIGPTYYGRFANGRVEDFYQHHVPLSCHDMHLVGPIQIAPILAQFHVLPIPNHILNSGKNNNHSTHKGDIFSRVQDWILMAQQSLSNTNQQESQPAATLFQTLQHEWAWLDTALHLTPDDQDINNTRTLARKFFSQIVFCHMDLQSLNLLRDTTCTSLEMPEKCTLKPIDFEYAGRNPRGVDIANTFCEHCDMNNLKANYVKEYPSIATQDQFIQHYIATLHQLQSQQQQQPTSSGTTAMDKQLPSLNQVMELRHNPQFLEAARRQIGRYTLVSHLSWSIWSIVQHSMSDIDFDYIAYAQHRLDGYYYMKKLYFD